MPWTSLFSLVLSLFLTALPAAGQAPLNHLSIEPGTRIRLPAEEPGREPVEGRLVELHHDWLSFRREGDDRVWTRPLVSIDTLLVSQGRFRNQSARRGMLWGVYLGTAAGAITGPLAAGSFQGSVGRSAAMLGAGGAVLGAGLGAVVGAILAPERWKRYWIVFPESQGVLPREEGAMRR